MSERRITPEEARAFYDRLGKGEDFEAAFQDRAFDRLVEHARFEEARAVLELGCGTGRFARRLFAELLPDDARYVGLDVSGHMVALTRERLADWGPRADVRRTEGELVLPFPDGAFDRFLAAYTLDLLSDDDIATALAEAQRVLVPDGLLCLVCLTSGDGGLPHLMMSAWGKISGWFPDKVGGCRPIRVEEHLPDAAWAIEHRSQVAALGVPSEVVVARPRAQAGSGSSPA